MVTETLATKIIFVSAGSLIVGLTQANLIYIILGGVGLVFSLANYHYDFQHNDTKEFVLSELIRYMFFGFLTLPLIYIGLEDHFKSEVLRMIIGSFASYYAVYIGETILQRIKSFILEYKK